MVGMNLFMERALPQLQKYVSDLGQISLVPEEKFDIDDRSTIEDQMRFHRILLKVSDTFIIVCSLRFAETALCHHLFVD